jgi:hypothetical protein
MNRNAILEKIFELERRSGAFRLNSTTENWNINTVVNQNKLEKFFHPLKICEE